MSKLVDKERLAKLAAALDARAKAAVEAEAARAMAAEEALQGAIDLINDAEKGILAQAKAHAEAKDAELKQFVEEADNALGERVQDLEEVIFGGEGAEDGIDKIKSDIAANKEAIDKLNGGVDEEGSVAKAVADEAALRESADTAINGRIDALAAVVGAPESDTEATGIFKVIEENEKTTASALTDLDTRLQEVESKKDSIESALQASDFTTGSANGTISVKGTDVKVKGLGSAAYTEASAYATAAQGAKADTAYQKPEAGIPLADLASSVYTQEEVNDMWAWAEL